MEEMEMDPTKKQQLGELRAMRSQVIGELRNQHNRLKEHRRAHPVLPVGVPKERNEIAFFKLNCQKDVSRGRERKVRKKIRYATIPWRNARLITIS
jgi:hypothetical protein